jgi:hypothetical protein
MNTDEIDFAVGARYILPLHTSTVKIKTSLFALLTSKHFQF